MQDEEKQFFERADTHIDLSNQQISEEVESEKVNASMMYATARFNAWVSARGWTNKQEMSEAKEETIDYFMTEYRRMLEANIDDYIKNFDLYMGIAEEKT